MDRKQILKNLRQRIYEAKLALNWYEKGIILATPKQIEAEKINIEYWERKYKEIRGN